MEGDSEETREWIKNHLSRHEQMLAEFRDEIPKRETRPATTSARSEDSGGSPRLLDALCRHREVLRRENNFLRGEVKTRGFATLAGKKAYMESHSNGTPIPPSLLPEELASRVHESAWVSFPYLTATPQDSLELLLHESNHLRYRMKSLISILKEFSIPVSSDKAKMRLFLMSRAAAMISKTMRGCSVQDAASSSRRLHRAQWESIWGSKRDTYGVFDDITTLSPMIFTPCTPGIAPYSATICSALQIYSLKIVDLNVNLNWPLRVYGVVAARDTVDHNRNILFYRSRHNYQLVTEHDPFLRLTGPSRAIVADDTITFEVELKIKYPGAEERQDTALFYRTYNWRGGHTTPTFRGKACAAKLSLDLLPGAFQATIVGVRLVAGSWPSRYGCRVSCSLSNAHGHVPSAVELLNCSSLDDVKSSPVGPDGYFALERNVVSVQLQSMMKVVIQAKSRLGGPCSHVEFPVQKYCQTSKASCFLVKCEVEVVVAWSLLVKEKMDLML